MASMNSSFDAGLSLLPAESNHGEPDDSSLDGDDGGHDSVAGYDDDDDDEAASVGSASSFRGGGGGDRCYSDPPGDLENHRSIVLDDDYYDFDDIESDADIDAGQEESASAADEGIASDVPNEPPKSGGASGASEGHGRRIAVRRTPSSSLRRRTSSSGSGGLGDGSFSNLSTPDESPSSDPKKILVSGLSSTTGSPVVIRARRSVPTAGTPERRTKLLVRASDAPRTPSQRGSSRRASRGVVVRSRSSGEDVVALQRAVASSSLRRTPTRTRRIVVRSRSDLAPSLPTTPTKSSATSSTTASPAAESSTKKIDGLGAVLSDELSGMSLAEASSTECERKSAEAKLAPSSRSTKQAQARSSGLSKSCHASKRSPSSSAGASSRRSNQLSSTTHGKAKSKSPISARRYREGSLDLAGDSKGSNKKSLDAHTIHVSRLTKERRRESKDSSRTASSLQLNIGDPSSVDLASFPALHDADSASTPPPARRCVSASAAPSAFSSSLQLDISNPSNVNTCSFPPADAADVGGSIEPASSSIAKGTTSADANAVVNAAARQPTKDSVPGLFFKVQSHILRHPIFTSQT